MSDDSPPSSYYDPPEPKCPSECCCEKCHAWHIEEGLVRENAKSPDYQCCKDEMEDHGYEAIEL